MDVIVFSSLSFYHGLDMFLATSDASVINGRCQVFFTISVGFGAYPVGLVGLEGKISIGALDIFNGGVENSMRVLKRVNGRIEKIRRGYCIGSMGAWRKGQVALKRVNGALVRVSGGIGQCQWGY